MEIRNQVGEWTDKERGGGERIREGQRGMDERRKRQSGERNNVRLGGW